MTTPDPTTHEIELAAAALAKSEHELLIDLGLALAGPGASRDGDADDLLGRANNFFERNRDELKRRVCGQPVLDKATDAAVDAAAVADLIATLTGQISAYTVAAILIKRGMHWLCGQ
jgi:hypothetical protein